MNRIIGDGEIPEAKAFYDVRDALEFEQDIYLCAHIGPLLGITLKDVAIYNLEPLYDGCRSFSVGYLEVLKRCHVLDYRKKNVEYLKSLGIEAFHMPYGYHKSLERAKVAEKDIDVLFVGSVNPRRLEAFDKLSKEVEFVWARGVYGDELDSLISRAKVHVNVHYCDPHPLEVVRVNYLMANHCNIVSEIGDEDQHHYKEGLRFAGYEGLIEACKQAMKNPIDGYDFIKSIPHDCGPARQWLSTR